MNSRLKVWKAALMDSKVSRAHFKEILVYYSSCIFSIIVSIYSKIFYEVYPEHLITNDSYIFAQNVFFLAPMVSILLRFAQDETSQHKQFLMVNGMNNRIYLMKIFLFNYMQVLFLALIKTIERYFLSIIKPFYHIEFNPEKHSDGFIVFFGNVAPETQHFFALFGSVILIGFALVNVSVFFARILSSKYVQNKTLFFALILFSQFYLIKYPVFGSIEDWTEFMVLVIFPLPVPVRIITGFREYIFNYNSILFVERTYDEQLAACLASPLAQKKSPDYCEKDIAIMMGVFEEMMELKMKDWITSVIIILASALFYCILNILLRFIPKSIDLKRFRLKKAVIKNNEVFLSMIQIGDKDNDDTNSLETSLLSKITETDSFQDEEDKPQRKQKQSIEIKGLTKSFGNMTALDDVSFSVSEGEVFCLLGHNGAGKTTLIHLLVGLSTPTNGTFLYDEKEMKPENIYRSIGFCSQVDNNLLVATVEENLKFFATLKGIPENEIEREVERVMTKLNLLTFKNSKVSKASAGWKRRVSIAIALLGDPKILILDEPTSGLDRISRKLFWELLGDWKAEKKTIVYTTQFFDEAENISDKIAVLSKGQLFAMGSVEYIKKKLNVGYTLILYNQKNINDIHQQRDEIDSVFQNIIPSAVSQNDTTLNTIKYILPFDQRENLPQLFSQLEQFKDLEINFHMQSLEDAFIGLKLNRNSSVHEKEKRESLGGEFSVYRSQATFWSQIKAVFFRKLRIILSEKLLVCSIFISWIISGLFYLFSSYCSVQIIPRTYNNLLAVLDPLILIVMIDFVIQDRSNNLNFVTQIMGLNPLAYWVGNFFVEFLVKIPALPCLYWLILQAIALTPKRREYALANIDKFVLVYISYVFNAITFYYSRSRLLSSKQPSRRIFVLALLFGAYWGVDYTNSIDEGSLINIIKYFLVTFILAPVVPVITTIDFFYLEGYQNKNRGFAKLTLTSNQKFLIFTLCGVIAGIINFIILIYFSSKFRAKKQKEIVPIVTRTSSTIIDERTVTNEKTRISIEKNQDVIKAIGVHKVFPNGFKALNDLSFGVERGQIFCILGPNGAGKTTTFDVLTQKLGITSGIIERNSPHLRIGICLQANTLWENLTIHQHFKFYASMKGLNRSEVRENISYLLEALGLTEQKEKRIFELNEGTKRKTCVGLAVIGAPDLILLDEPTTGVDPIGRSQIWSLLKALAINRGSSVIMSTHYMEDAELIADKLGIIVNGTFATIGTLSELRKKYEDYLIVIDGLSLNNFPEVERTIQSLLPKAKLDPNPEQKGVVFRVPYRSMKFGKVFHVMENFKSRAVIQEFFIYTTTLEQVFIRLSRKQSIERFVGEAVESNSG